MRLLKPKRTIEEQDPQVDPQSGRVLGYVRQSSTKQVEQNTESPELQEAAIRTASHRAGMQEITVLVEGGGKRGVSASKLRIDQRKELRSIIAEVKAGTCKAVAVKEVSRLFRPKFMAEVEIFMEALAEHGVLLLTEAQDFDFRRENDRLIFRLLADFAGRKISGEITAMNEASKQAAMRGDYRGGGIPVGFVVCRDKTSPQFGRFIVYEPHARVVRRLYKRYRELNGRFNLLAREVAMMPFVFPDFESWVDERDVRSCLLKKVPDGYHISKRALFRLLTAYEYAGYWVYSTKNTEGELEYTLLTDEQGKPKQNHEAIVPLGDWQFAFSHLSFTTLDGEENVNRVGRHTTWTQRKSPESVALLKGILTSPLGHVQHNGDVYRVVAPVEGKHSFYSNTLTITSAELDFIFTDHLIDSLNYIVMGDYARTDYMRELLQQVQAQHAQELVTVPEQIAGYERDIAVRQAAILKLGVDGDIKTVQKYNTEIKELRGIIIELEEKANAAAVEEEELQGIVDDIEKANNDWSKMKLERRQLFITLITKLISIDELSAHFLRLTVLWKGPFEAPRDDCYIFRADGSRVQWSDQDDSILEEMYPHADRFDILQRFPTRSWMSIAARAEVIGLQRYTRLNTYDCPKNLSLTDWHLIQRYHVPYDDTWQQQDLRIFWVQVMSSVDEDLAMERRRCRPFSSTTGHAF
jgi:DNA invertase Pin-like site-specific DNA recombinase